MIFARHNLTDNFFNALKDRDTFTLKQIAIDEMARTIVEQKKDVVKMLRRHGLNAAYSMTPSQLSRHVVSEIKKGNKEVADKMAELVVLNYIDAEKAEKKAKDIFGDGGGVAGFMEENKGTIMSLTETFSGLFGSIFSKKKSSGGSTVSGDDLIEERLRIAESEYARSGKGKKQVLPMGVKILIGVGAFALVGIATFLIVQNVRNRRAGDAEV
jgi:hypothetical protein